MELLSCLPPWTRGGKYRLSWLREVCSALEENPTKDGVWTRGEPRTSLQAEALSGLYRCLIQAQGKTLLEGPEAPPCSSLIPELIFLAEARQSPQQRYSLPVSCSSSLLPGDRGLVLLSFLSQPNLGADDGGCTAQGSKGHEGKH